jgi:hypothetical protein
MKEMLVRTHYATECYPEKIINPILSCITIS